MEIYQERVETKPLTIVFEDKREIEAFAGLIDYLDEITCPLQEDPVALPLGQRQMIIDISNRLLTISY